MTRECFHVTLLKSDLAVTFHLLLCWSLVEFCSPSVSTKPPGDVSKVAVPAEQQSSVSSLHTRAGETFLSCSLRYGSAHCRHATVQHYQNNVQLVM